MKKKNRRNSSQYPGLDRSLNLKIRYDLLDQDYIEKLSEEEKAWLSKFNEEYVSCNFEKTKSGTFSKAKNLQKTEKLRKDCYNKNNARNRCIYSRSKSKDLLKGEKDLVSGLENQRSTNEEDTENLLINIIDAKNSKD